MRNFVSHIDLDIQGLDIKSVKDEKGYELDFRISSPKPELGSLLYINLGEMLYLGQAKIITIDYETNSEQEATSWLTKEQTSTKRQPFMFTQCEAIHCRSVAPF